MAAPAALHAARRAVAESLAEGELNLVGCSGGADSLALAAAAAWHHRKDAGPHRNTRVGAVVVDHHLHPRSVEISGQAVRQLKALGLEPVRIVPAAVDQQSTQGPEAAARTGRYAAFRSAMKELGAVRLLTAHTKDDQAEQVLLGLARGSGTRSLAGIPAVRGPYRRPLLGLSRAETEEICLHHGLSWWTDPANSDPRYLRSRLRTEIMPHLQERLSPTIKDALARTASIAAEDAAYLEEQAKEIFPTLLEDPDPSGALRLRLTGLRAQPPAIRRRIVALAAVAAGAPAPSFERIQAVDRLVDGGRSRGPVQLEGELAVYRGARGTSEYGKLILIPPSPG
ncbi:tRNA lysidine(34) synthetase TilS [Nesterenkonia sp. NBAIMH1]|uniref:tRNA lysidine(34) synthetase TilS n=1 Tax=Nesterenkonia sp. NBAIMH1 TaxID=2600320 RepID=UPI0011B369AA|nr:tRNA lysidine(34) synthetase TilS [Nesterenkonia sp. NBAIMH1]